MAPERRILGRELTASLGTKPLFAAPPGTVASSPTVDILAARDRGFSHDIIGRLPTADAQSNKSLRLEQTEINRNWDFGRLL